LTFIQRCNHPEFKTHETSPITTSLKAGPHIFCEVQLFRIFWTQNPGLRPSHHWSTKQTNHDSLDWKDLSATEITERVTGKVQSGSICLFHNAALHTPEALPSILGFFQTNGYKVVPISQIILQGDYYMDHTGKQCPVESE